MALMRRLLPELAGMLLLAVPACVYAMQPSGDMAECFVYTGRGPMYGIMGEKYQNNCGKPVNVGICMRNQGSGPYATSAKAVGCVSQSVRAGEPFAVTGGIISVVACSGTPNLDERMGSASCPESQRSRSGDASRATSQAPVQTEEERQLENDLKRLTERPSKGDPVNGCLKLIDKRGAGFEKAFQNTCSYPVQYTYCVEDPKSLFRCRGNPPKGEGADSVGPGGWRAIPDWYNGGRIHWLACKGKLGEVLPMLNTNGKSGCF